MRRAIFVNPWIIDFAAYNLWARPFGLLQVIEALSEYDLELSYVDCLSDYSIGRYGKGKYKKHQLKKPSLFDDIKRPYFRYGVSLGDFEKRICELLPIDFVFITSVMSYWYLGVKEVVNILRRLTPDSKIILGGIYATLYPEHAAESIGPDYIHTGPLRKSLFELPMFADLKKTGIKKPYYGLPFYINETYAPISLSTGCPFRCPYCASSVLNPAFSQKEPGVLFNEIRDMASMGITDFAFYDDALLVNSEKFIKPLLRMVVDEGLNLRFHCPNGLHVRFIDDELAFLMYRSGFKTLRLSLETINSKRLDETGQKLTAGEFSKALRTLKKSGFNNRDLGTYIMCGLNGQGLDEVWDSVEFLKSEGVCIHINEYSPIPGTKCYNKLVKDGVIPKDLDPLLTNNTVYWMLFSDYSVDEFMRLKASVRAYNHNLISGKTN